MHFARGIAGFATQVSITPRSPAYKDPSSHAQVPQLAEHANRTLEQH